MSWTALPFSFKQGSNQIEINGEQGKITLGIFSRITTPTKEYTVRTIASLLQQDIEAEDPAINNQIRQIREKDKALVDELLTVIGNSDLIGKDKAYQLHNGKIRYSSGTRQSTEPNAEWKIHIWPSADFITEDIKHFQPITNNFSRDKENVYYKSHKIWSNQKVRPHPEKFKPLEESNYWFDGENVFHGFNRVPWAITYEWKYEIISNERVEVLKDSHNQFFSWHEKMDIAHPEKCEHVLENFFFDGESVYMIAWGCHNITKLYRLPSGEAIQKLDSANPDYDTNQELYKIGDTLLSYNGELELNVLQR